MSIHAGDRFEIVTIGGRTVTVTATSDAAFDDDLECVVVDIRFDNGDDHYVTLDGTVWNQGEV